jgi:hypothetical protein
MSNEALTWAFRQTAPSTGAKFVLVALADLANHEHRAWPGQAKLAAMTGQGVRSVIRHLLDLEQANLVTRERRNHGYTKRLVDGFLLPVSVVAGVPKPVDAATQTPANLTPVDLTPANLTPAKDGEDTRQTGRIKEPKKNPKNPKNPSTSAAADARPEVIDLCGRLADQIAANDEDGKRPSIGKGWLDACRLLLDRDKRDPAKVAAMIDWCQADEFWRTVVLSMPKFRKQYDQMRKQALAEWERNKRPRRDFAAERQAQRDDQNGWMSA